jgi:bifunctional non-homologous end joining protein LigD
MPADSRRRLAQRASFPRYSGDTPTQSKTDPLATYARKRNFAETPEPAGAPRASSRRLRFVIQQHRATRLHYDFRLEAGGVLASWAVPKGPSLDPHERRLAMHVEDHPFAYRTFEGIIPAGNYGAGEVIVWDEGTYTLAAGDDPLAEIAAGKMKFILRGKKLRGMFTLVKIRAARDTSGEPWLLIKDHDEHVDPSWTIDAHAQSAKTGKTLADIAAGASGERQWKSDRPAAPSATRKRVERHASAQALPAITTPMLATLGEAPFDNDDWLFELKWDGYRAIALIGADASVQLTSRNGNDLLAQFAELAAIGAAFGSLPIVVDGEICVLDERGRSSFQALQTRDARPAGKRTRGAAPVTFVAFDCLYADGRDIRAEPLEARKAQLERLIIPGHGVMYSKHVIGNGRTLYDFAVHEQLEGIIGKLRTSPYRSTRSREWVKFKARQRQEFVIGGWTEPRGSRRYFGALLLGVYAGETLVYAGHVGSGFDAAKLRGIAEQLVAIEQPSSPFAVTPKTNTKAHWVAPTLVAEIEFAEWTRDAILRQAVFIGMRTDKAATAVVRERPAAAPE